MDENEPLEQAQQRDIVTIKQVSSGRFLVGQYRGDWNVVTSDNTFPSGDDPRWSIPILSADSVFISLR
ncbi:MAG: hypothetical protein WCA06_12510, partial [Terrimicrobiaceae bacterium]